MKHITFYLDFVSPYAWLAYERLPDALEGLSYSVSYKPVLLGALLQQHANPGPAGIAPKRDWTYRHVTWLGHAQGTALQMPARHPFNPLPLLRQALACSDDGCINRFVAGALLRHVWQGGHDALEGLSYSVSYKPVLLGALLQQHANPGPAGIAPKRDWTYRHVTWLGHAQGTPLQMPARHPFNPLPLLRQALACSDDGCINRFVAGALLRHVWQGGHDALDAERLRVLAEQLSEQVRPGQDMHSDGPKALLRANTEAAQAAGVFGVPAFEVDGKLFWGLDGLPMLRAYLDGDAWFDGPQWDAVTQVPSGLAPAAKG